MEEKIEFKIPEHVIDYFIKEYNTYPSIIRIDNVTKDGFDALQSKNENIWFDKYIKNNKETFLDLLINYGNNKIMIYLKKVENENTYKVFIFTYSHSNDSIYLLLKGLNKFFTIN